MEMSGSELTPRASGRFGRGDVWGESWRPEQWGIGRGDVLVIEEGKLVFKYPENMDARSQDLEKHYHDVGQFYILRTEAFQRNRKLMLGNIMPYVLPEMEVQDIDTPEDWAIAEIKYQMLKSKME